MTSYEDIKCVQTDEIWDLKIIKATGATCSNKLKFHKIFHQFFQFSPKIIHLK